MDENEYLAKLDEFLDTPIGKRMQTELEGCNCKDAEEHERRKGYFKDAIKAFEDAKRYYDYDLQCWVVDGRVAKCGHLELVKGCYACAHAGELVEAEPAARCWCGGVAHVDCPDWHGAGS